jgi:regulator of PEP synthase PpsR (kinase-PPPase family)
MEQQIIHEKKCRIIILSDGTGETCHAMLKAALTQFPKNQMTISRYKNIRTHTQLDSIFAEAVIHHDLIIYTIVKADLREYLVELSRSKHVRTVDLMGDLLTSLASYLQTVPSSLPGLMHAVDDQYFKRVAAMEFTLNHDDGQNIKSLHLADVILIGISRTSKTPLSIYLSLHGIKVVNVPLIKGSQIHEEIFKVDQRKIFALTIDVKALWEIRKNRMSSLGVTNNHGEYADFEKIIEEVEWAKNIFSQNKRWPILDVTGKAVEELASEIIRLLNMRQHNLFKQNKRFEP